MPQQYDDDDEDRVPTATSGKAIASLVLAVLSFCLPVLLSLPSLILGILGIRDVNRSKGRLTGLGLAIAGIVISCVTMLLSGPVLLALLLPAIQKVRYSAANVQSSNNLKMIGAAAQNYMGDHNRFPPDAIRDKQGKSLLSWRVRLLPYLGQNALYSQFKLDEPWDSINNKPLLSQMPKVYINPKCSPPTEKEKTYYLAIVGKNTSFEDPTGMPPGQFDAQKIIIVESANPVNWTEPVDLDLNDGPLMPRLGAFDSPKINALYGDSAVRPLTRGTDEKTLKQMIELKASP